MRKESLTTLAVAVKEDRLPRCRNWPDLRPLGGNPLHVHTHQEDISRYSPEPLVSPAGRRAPKFCLPRRRSSIFREWPLFIEGLEDVSRLPSARPTGTSG